METRQQLERWSQHADDAPKHAVADLDVAKRLVKHGLECLDEIERLRAELDRQGKTAIMGMDAAKASAFAMLDKAKKLNAESSSEYIESERAMNAILTDEIERLREENARLRNNYVEDESNDV